MTRGPDCPARLRDTCASVQRTGAPSIPGGANGLRPEVAEGQLGRRVHKDQVPVVDGGSEQGPREKQRTENTVP